MRASDLRRARLAWGFVALLGVLHCDFWWWEDRTIVLGFLPIGLAWHALLSILAAFAWAWVGCFAWPARLEEWARGSGERP